MADRGPSSVGRKVLTVGAVTVALLAVGAAVFAWYDSRASTATFCTAAGTISDIVRPTPEEAFEAWWSEVEPDGRSLDDITVDQHGTTFDVDKDGDWRRVEVDPAGHWLSGPEAAEADAKGWTVTSANRCSETTV